MYKNVTKTSLLTVRFRSPREYVVKILLQTIPNMSFSRAYAVMDMAHTTGKGLVITTNMVIVQPHRSSSLMNEKLCSLNRKSVLFSSKEMAEAYCEAITKAGILSTVEPAD
uniref:Uncharacterized protein n=1 Tax=Rhodosorus marinus TaxID=101924 RepID=A0A7S2ZXG9_9RHOD